MCLAVPGQITEIYEANGLRMCKIDFGGVIREACIETLPEAQAVLKAQWDAIDQILPPHRDAVS